MPTLYNLCAAAFENMIASQFGTYFFGEQRGRNAILQTY
jgi:hypothetical protein